LRPGLQLAGIVLFVTLGYGTAGIAFAYAAAFVVVAVIGIALLYWLSEFSVQEVVKRGPVRRYRELLTFSVPLAASGAINVIAKHSDLIILGTFKSSSVVGLYEVAFRIGIMIPVLFMPAIGFLYQPIMSRLHSNGDEKEMGMLYVVATRWMVLGGAPLFALFFLFPEQTLTFLFGARYSAG
ncbi:MAG: oligosaccharide flippase family protein, partial [Halobacteriaceae archaeon]